MKAQDPDRNYLFLERHGLPDDAGDGTSSIFADTFGAKYVVKEWNNGEDVAFCITWYPRDSAGWPEHGHFCGYAMFPVMVLPDDASIYDVHVHGGITYVSVGSDGKTIYGFDCNHNPPDRADPQKHDIDWLTKETERMADSIFKVARERRSRVEGFGDGE